MEEYKFLKSICDSCDGILPLMFGFERYRSYLVRCMRDEAVCFHIAGICCCYVV